MHYGAPEVPSVMQGREEREGSSARHQRSERVPEKARENLPKHLTAASVTGDDASGDAPETVSSDIMPNICVRLYKYIYIHAVWVYASAG